MTMKQMVQHEHLKRLDETIRLKQEISRSDFFAWVSECVDFFTKIELSETIINLFIQDCDPSHWPTDGSKPIWVTSDSQQIIHINIERLNTWYIFQVTFQAAASKINLEIDAKKIVPNFLIEQLDQYSSKGKNIAQSLKDIQDAYEKNHAKAVVEHANTCLEHVLNLYPTWKTLSSKGRLQSMENDQTTRDLFATHESIVRALQISIVVRDKKVKHPEVHTHQDVSMVIAAALASLILLFTEATIAAGNFQSEL